MTTDLTGDFELGEEEFEWDVFAPDPDEAALAAEAAALDEQDESDLDDSDFAWDAALRDDTEPGTGAESEARAGAAYDRIVDTVRRSLEEPEPAVDKGAGEPVEDEWAEVIQRAEEVQWTEDVQWVAEDDEATVTDGDETPASEPAEWTARTGALFGAPEAENELDRENWLAESDLRHEAGAAVRDEPAAATEPDASRDFRTDAEPALQPAFDVAQVEARIAEMAAAVASVTAPEPFPVATPDPVPPVGADEVAVDGVAVDGVALDEVALQDAPAEEVDEAGEDGVAVEATSLVPPPTRKPPTHKRHEQSERSRVYTATVVLACIVLVILAAVAVVRWRHHPATEAQVSPAAETARIQAATDALDSATTSATVGLSSLASFPTPSNVEKIINPYMSSLQLYGTLLSGSAVPAAARADASTAETQVHQDLRFLDTIETLPPLQLGAFLKQFDSDATQLQTTLSALEQNLRASTS